MAKYSYQNERIEYITNTHEVSEVGVMSCKFRLLVGDTCANLIFTKGDV